MKVQDMINELQTILKEHGNLEIVTRDPHMKTGVVYVSIYAEDAKPVRIFNQSGDFSFKAVKISNPLDD